jgi:hypothetical protein
LSEEEKSQEATAASSTFWSGVDPLSEANANQMRKENSNMRHKEDIVKELSDLDRQEADLQAEIETKTKELAEARASNQNLLRKYVGVSKKPMSLSIQAGKIQTFELELTQLKEMAPLIEERRAELRSELRLVDASQQFQEYSERATKFFEKLDVAKGLLSQAADIGPKLETLVQELRNENPLSSLNAIFQNVDSLTDLDKIGFDGLDRYRFATETIRLEKQLDVLIRAVRSLSDFGYGLENITLRNLKWPPDKKTNAVEKDHERVSSGAFDGSSYLGRRLNKNQSAM